MSTPTEDEQTTVVEAEKPPRRKPGWPVGRPRPNQRHGLQTLKRAVRDLGGRLIDQRTAVGRALADWRHALIADLGGAEDISTQQAALVDLAVRTKLMIDSVDAWLLDQRSIINKRKRALFPVVRERTQLADALVRILKELGLERRAKPATNMQSWLEGRKATPPPDNAS